MTAQRLRRSAPDALLAQLASEARAVLRAEPVLTALIDHVVAVARFEQAAARRIGARLAAPELSGPAIEALFLQSFEADGDLAKALAADALAVIERDPAADMLLTVLLHFKGFHALQTHRLAHWLWRKGRRDLALFLQSRASEIFHTDIHPAARIGSGVFLDHATGFVAGETTVIGDHVSILHEVTLGGTGTGRGERHPRIGANVLIGAGAKLLGPITVGDRARVAAGSVVLTDVPPDTTVAGVPARVVGAAGSRDPSTAMDHVFVADSYASFTYVI